MILPVPVAYRLEFRPGDPLYYSLEDFALEKHKQGSTIRGLYLKPQPGCPTQPDAYRTPKVFVPRKYSRGLNLSTMTPLYLGPVLHDPSMGVITYLSSKI